MSRKWYPSPFIISQMLHFFVGSSFVLGAEALHLPWYEGAIFILAIAAVKETTFDIRVEGGTYRDGLVDWLFYLLGCLASAAVTVL